ncbi:MAG TPA: N-acetyltransferase [Candidatus Binatia bacterium]|nr:N-acetyltransferase [Candidatus Binatia bacterium]
MPTLRNYRDHDFEAVLRVHACAFPTRAESDLVAALIQERQARVSLVVEYEGELAGHVLFSPVTVDERSDVTGGLGLAPLAVLPRFQRVGLGSLLTRRGLARAREAGNGFAVVLGSPSFYTRFGFRPAAQSGLRCIYTDGDEFMALELQPGALDGVAGLVRYAPQFDALEK